MLAGWTDTAEREATLARTTDVKTVGAVGLSRTGGMDADSNLSCPQKITLVARDDADRAADARSSVLAVQRIGQLKARKKYARGRCPVHQKHVRFSGWEAHASRAVLFGVRR